MEATPPATSRARINREHPVVTRHGLRSPLAETPLLRRMHPGTPFTKITANVLDIGRGQIPILASPAKNLTHQALAGSSAQPIPPSP